MTQQELLTQIDSNTRVIKRISDSLVETAGTIEKHSVLVYLNTPEGFRNLESVWYILDTATGEATFQNVNTLDNTQNNNQKKIDALTNYLKATFFAFFLKESDLVNNWATAEVFVDGTTLTKKTVLVYKKGTNPITHKDIV